MRSTRLDSSQVTSLVLSTLRERLAIHRLDQEVQIPTWAVTVPFCSITRTPDELFYDTDYVLVKESQLEHAGSVLSERGHVVRK